MPPGSSSSIASPQPRPPQGTHHRHLFAAAILIPTLTRHPSYSLLALGILFAALGTLNGLYITFWETPRTPFFLQSYRILNGFALTLIAASIALALATRSCAPLAIALAAAALLLLHTTRTRLHPTTLRAAADLALLTPLLLWPFIR